MMNHKDKQVEAFLNAINQDCYIESTKEADPTNVEFIIDGVVNVRAALDAALAVERDGSATDTKGISDE